MVLEQGMRITPFVRLWSTMTINESCPLEGGRSVMRSTESCLKGRGGRGRDRGKWGVSWMVIDFVLLTHGASSDEGVDK